MWYFLHESAAVWYQSLLKIAADGLGISMKLCIELCNYMAAADICWLVFDADICWLAKMVPLCYVDILPWSHTVFFYFLPCCILQGTVFFLFCCLIEVLLPGQKYIVAKTSLFSTVAQCYMYILVYGLTKASWPVLSLTSLTRSTGTFCWSAFISIV